jgi:hypothetical protein
MGLSVQSHSLTLVFCPLARSQDCRKAEPYLELPEDAACVAVVVLPQGNVFKALPVCLQVVLHMLEKPRLIVTANAIQLK